MLFYIGEQQFPGRQKSQCLRQSVCQPSQSNLLLFVSRLRSLHKLNAVLCNDRLCSVMDVLNTGKNAVFLGLYNTEEA